MSTYKLCSVGRGTSRGSAAELLNEGFGEARSHQIATFVDRLSG